jgi:mannose-6-phosphate isomerase
MNTQTEQRPWGEFTILLDSDKCKVKTITIRPGHYPSYQYHFKRNEHWILIQGEGVLTLNDEDREVHTGDHVYVNKGDKHQIINSGTEDLVFIEIQTGEYFGEDDIVRLDDRYGRV